MNEKKISIPKEVQNILETIEKKGFEAFIVGGCVRDLLIGRKPHDWDVTTNAKPEEIKKIFPKSFYENRFFTVTVLTESEEKNLKEIEVTTYRGEGKYSDKRRPDEVYVAQTIEADLSRRDFTINAMALGSIKNQESKIKQEKKHDSSLILNSEFLILDPFGGKDDLKKKIICTVRDSEERFYEDALRMMRAVRLAVELDFTLSKETERSIKKHAASIKDISEERVRDELKKIFMSARATRGVQMLEELELLQYIIPELREGIGVGQNLHHYIQGNNSVWKHNLKAFEWAVKKDYPILVKIAALLHDVGKPRCKQGEGYSSTFYNHDLVGAKIARILLQRLRFSRDEVEKITTLIRWHLFKYDPEEGITDSSVRRLIQNVGAENMKDLVLVRICDRMGSGVPKAVPYRLRHFQYRVEKILREEEKPTVKMLKMNGNDLIKELKMKPSLKMGLILNALLEEIIDNPEKNTREYLLQRASQMLSLSDHELKKFAESAKQKVTLLEEERDLEIKQKHWIK